MKQFCLFPFLVLLMQLPANASHITGGEMSYTYDANFRYNFTLKLYMRCNSGRIFNNPNIISVFDKGTGNRISDESVMLIPPSIISIEQPDQCITNPPYVCYEVGYYHFSLFLPPTASGYIIASEVNFRIAGISNLQPGSSQVGATYTAEVPGTNVLPGANINNSARFIGSDLVIICANNRFNYSFAAIDPDGDELSYTFCYAYQASNSGGGTSPALNPPYISVPYGNGFSATTPLGPLAEIDPQTGMISGTAPPDGVYVVTVCVSEIRNGVVIAVQRKDLQVFIAGCSIAAASLAPSYSVCRDSYHLTATNLSNDPLIDFYEWKIFDRESSLIFTSSLSQLDYTFSDTGTYLITLKIATGQGCSDSTTSLARVYPGFRPAFTAEGFCFPRLTNFRDGTTSAYGTTNSWNWDFGDLSAITDQSALQHPSYQYNSTGFKTVLLKAGNSVGCIDTISKVVNIFDKPPITFLFRDTLICRNDRVQLIAQGSGNFSWLPANNITNASTSAPVVFPPVSTFYVVQLENDGCINRDSVQVRVVDHVSLAAMADTTACTGDPVRLKILTDAFLFTWSPAALLDDPQAFSPIAISQQTTTYSVTAILGGCTATEEITVHRVDYPTAFAGNDTTICFGTMALVNGQSNGSMYNWSPQGSLINANLLNTIATPEHSTLYILSAFDTKGCPKPGIDSMRVLVLPKVRAFAGRDTSVVIGQPLQLQGSGGTSYAWEPGEGLSSSSISNPVVVFNEGSEGRRFKLTVGNEAGCLDSAYVTVKIFENGPAIYVPSAFTPGEDGLNDLLRPIGAGIGKLDYFAVYNRFGMEVFRTTQFGKGWNGKINGRLQDPASYIWIIKAVDYKGRPYSAKGSSILIR